MYQQPWETRGVPGDWKEANIFPVFKKGNKEDPANYRPDNLGFGLYRIIKKIILGGDGQSLKDHARIGQSQHRFMKQKLINLLEGYFSSE